MSTCANNNDDVIKNKHHPSAVDPLVTFQAVPHNATSASSVTSLCFLTPQGSSHENETRMAPNRSVGWLGDDDSLREEDCSSEEEFESHFQSTNRNATSKDSRSAVLRHRLGLEGVKLATCDFAGHALIWDVASSSVVGRLGVVNDDERSRGPGLLLRRTCGSDNRFLYHTRDGTVSLQDVERLDTTVTSFDTQSRTFCAAAPCHGDEHLVALPSQDDSEVVVRDWRVPPSAAPVASFQGGGGTSSRRQHGMLTSLAMCKMGSTTRALVCGMEDGSVFIHDWTRPTSKPRGSLSLGTDPVLTLDVSPSPPRNKDDDSMPASFVCLAGLAGDAQELGHLAEADRGRLAVVKATMALSNNDDDASWRMRIRTRLGTAPSKPGVAMCRWRPDGRLYVAGGWDRRVRVVHRDGRALAILRGGGDSIQAVDWFPDAASGLLASGSADGRVCVWRTFGTNE